MCKGGRKGECAGHEYFVPRTNKNEIWLGTPVAGGVGHSGIFFLIRIFRKIPN